MPMAFLGAVSQGVLWGVMVLGVYITYKLLDIADLSVDGTLALGGCVCAVCVTNGVDPLVALLLGMLAGCVAGLVTGILHTVLEIPAILSGILTMISLWSINLRIMGKSNVPLLQTPTVFSTVATTLGVPQSVASLIICAGIFLWDYNRTKVRYYKDYVEVWDIPKGVGRLSDNEMSHRDITYRMEFRQRKLRRLALVNSAGKVVRHRDTEHTSSRYSDTYFFYTDEGRIDYKTIYDETGKALFKMDYDENLKTATFRRNDEFGTEFNFDANKNELYKSGSSAFDEKSLISRYLLTYNDEGQLTEIRYAGLQNIPACDASHIYGERFKYDNKGRQVEKEYVGADGTTTTDKNGLAIRVFTYDEDDNWTSVSYLNTERNASHDGNNCSLVKLEYDEWGNRVKEMYYTLDGEPAIRTDQGVAGFCYTYTPNGFRETLTCLDTEGKPTFCLQGYVVTKDSFNDNGFVVNRSYLDDNNMPVTYMYEGESYSSIAFAPNEHGQFLEISCYDKDGKPMMQTSGYYKLTQDFDSKGNITKVAYFDTSDRPAEINGFYHCYNMEYDSLDNLVRQCYIDEKGNPATDDGIVTEYRMEYNRQGALTKIQYLGTKGKPVNCSNLFSAIVYEYDEVGNRKTMQYLDTLGKITKPYNGYAKSEYVYEQKTNLLNAINYYDVNGKKTGSEHMRYDGRGNIIESYTLTDGKLAQGSVVTHTVYDANNHETEEWYTDLSGKRVNGKNGYSKVKYEYDKRGNCIASTYWTADDKPTTDTDKAHKRVREYDKMNRVVVEKNFDTEEKPVTGDKANPEGRVKYDQWGNMTEIACYDGYGKPRLSADGYHREVKTYDHRRNLLKEEYFDTEGKPVMSKSDEYAKAEYTYNSHGKQTESKYYDTKKCVRIYKATYNEHGEVTEYIYCDGNGKPSDEFFGYSKLTVEYEADGVTPKMRKVFNAKGTQLAKWPWDKKKNDWGEMVYTGPAQAPVQNYNTGWQSGVRSDAASCPIKLADGVYLYSVTYSGNSVHATIKMVEKSLYDTEDIDIEALRQVARELKPVLRKAWALPSNVSLTLSITDKANRNICSV